MRPSRRAEGAAILLVAGVSGLLYLLSLNGAIAGHDESAYIMLARSIATGQGYRDLNLPGSPPSTLRPFGYPLLLAPVMLLQPSFPGNVIALKLVSVALGVVSVLVVQRWARSMEMGLEGSLALACIVAWAPLTLLFATRTLSEMAYLLWSLLALLLIARWEKTGYRIGGVWLLAAGCLAMAYFTRVVGLSLAAAVLIYLALKRQWRAGILTGLILALLISPWVYRNIAVASSALAADYVGSYFFLRDMQRPFLGTIGVAELLGRLVGNLHGHITESIPWLLFPWGINGWWPTVVQRLNAGFLKPLPAVLGYVVFILAASGFVLSLRRRLRAEHVYVVLFLGITLLPPWHVERNLWPLLPFLVYYLFVALAWLSERVAGRWKVAPAIKAAAAAVICLAIFAGFAMSDRHQLASGAAYRAGRMDQGLQDTQMLADWVASQTDRDAVILYRDPERLYLYSDRKAIDIPMIPDPASFAARLAAIGVDYVIWEPFRTDVYAYAELDRIYLQPAVDARPQTFALLDRLGQDSERPAAIIYRFSPDGVTSQRQ